LHQLDIHFIASRKIIQLYADDESFYHHHWYITATDGNIQGFKPTFGHDFQYFKVD